MTKYRLPWKPSKLIRVSLEDLEAVEEDPDYLVEMGVWHSPMSRFKCQVCLAGAVMSKRLGIKPMQYIPSPQKRGGFSRKEVAQLTALEFFRTGDVHGGLIRLADVGLIPHAKVDLALTSPYDRWPPLVDGIPRNVPRYENDPPAFKTAMRNMAQALEERGL